MFKNIRNPNPCVASLACMAWQVRCHYHHQPCFQSWSLFWSCLIRCFSLSCVLFCIHVGFCLTSNFLSLFLPSAFVGTESCWPVFTMFLDVWGSRLLYWKNKKLYIYIHLFSLQSWVKIKMFNPTSSHLVYEKCHNNLHTCLRPPLH